MHFGMRFRHPERTLTGDEVERAVQNVVAHASRRLSAALRA
jgi:phenylalanyl-tRNA synthetase beta chain